MIWWKVLKGTYSSVWTNAPSLFVSGLPTMAAFACMIWGPYIGHPAAILSSLVFLLVGLFLMSMLLVSFQRRLLGVAPRTASLLRLRPTKRDWKAFGTVIVFWLASRAMKVFLGGLLEFAEETVIYVVNGLYIIALLFVLPRILPALLHVAIDTPEAIKTSWRNSQGTGILFWVTAASILALMIILLPGAAAMPSRLEGIFPSPVSTFMSVVAISFILVLASTLAASLLAQLHLLRNPRASAHGSIFD